MIQIKDKSACCGCHACANRCPAQCISMRQDGEGFLYPVVDTARCLDCGLCEKVCPVLNALPDMPKPQRAYLVQNRDEKILQESTSGGAFTAIAEYVVDRGGVVFGAAFDEDFQVTHTFAETKEDLARFRNSKYVQSSIGDSYKQAEKFLLSGRLVCFSGTPCQVEGLYHYLQKPYENLILVDVVCRAVPSPRIFQLYLAAQKADEYTVDTIRFRDKKPYGYQYSQMALYKDNEQIYRNGVETDRWLRAFFSNICDRPSCYQCLFKKRYRISDFTLWDCFDPDSYVGGGYGLDTEKGITNVVLQTPKAERIFESMRDSLFIYEADAGVLAKKTYEMLHCVKPHPKRAKFFADLAEAQPDRLFKTYFPETTRVRAERFLRRLLVKFRFYRDIKRFARKIKSLIRGT